MTDQLLIRMGDGERVLMPADEVWEDLRTGTADAAERGRIPELSDEDLERLFDLFADPAKIVGVAPGEEVVVTDDACSSLYYLEQENSGQGLPMGRVQAALTYERTTAADTVSMGHVDYSFKQVKPIINCEKNDYYSASLQTTIPLFYGSQPNMGLYFRPDGPFPNPAELMPSGKIAEAREAQEMAVETMIDDVVYIGRELYAVGCEGFNLDTSGSGGDADFLAALQAVEGLKKVAPDMPVELGMASEFVLGMHGEVAYKGTRLAGLFPHEQVRVAEEAGVDIFGPAVNVHSGRSMPWNLARTVTFVKETVARARIPVHPNVGMGVCGVPMFEVPPVDAVTRVSKALVQIGKADGLQVGTGDIFGVTTAHILASAMGGIRTAGDLVAWMQMTRRMKIRQAKDYVAEKLGIAVLDLSNEEVMRSIREDLDIGVVTAIPGGARGIAAKMKIARLLDVPINSVNIFQNKIRDLL